MEKGTQDTGEASMYKDQFLPYHPIVWVTGVVLLCVGTSVQLRLTDISVVLSETTSGAPVVLAVTGIIIFLLSAFGAVAALKENNVLIKIYSAMMLLMFIIEIIVGISAYSYRDKLQSEASRRFQQILVRYGSEEQLTRGIDRVQQQFRCCGAQNFTDWFNTSSAFNVPTSCCQKVAPRCGEKATENTGNIYVEGCVVKLRNWIAQHVDIIGAVGVGLGFAQIIGIFLSFLLVKILQENYVSL
ncbi:hypothetical protein GDO86_016672 [Hymenochirus boettgeri]|uniref:Tetraspanin n=1 Tax=Hymenochirus boettgeri TaxID=247094 RepID=A0A8T2IKG3_9PIPI|nr:hypothetical protein GDO86_016672 [Hymenochirus boettgeri]